MADMAENFIKNIINNDLKLGKNEGRVYTRFPPEPNGYLHVGHAKAICLNFTLAQEYAPHAECHLRFDDTNPCTEEDEYARAIEEDVRWLGFDWGDHHYHASDYFEKLYEYAKVLIRQGDAYVCSLTAEEIRASRGTLTTSGNLSPYRDRSPDENLDLFERMKNGEFKDGEHVLRAKIDMNSGNINMRDPVIYRIRHVEHPRTKNKWCIYPMYDYTHCISDALEKITHSLCTLEFEDHRPLYDWFLERLNTPYRPQQIEFSRLNLDYTITSKRKLLQLVEEGHVEGWDDPRMPTLKGLRRRGFVPESIRRFCADLGVSKQNSVIEYSLLEQYLREDLNQSADRAMAVLNPLKLRFSNFKSPEMLKSPKNPQQESSPMRELPFDEILYIEHDDFSENPPKGFHRLQPGGEVRLRNAYVIRCDEVRKNADGSIDEILCSIDYDTLGKNPEGRKVKGIIHWVSALRNHKAPVRVYDRLFLHPNPAAEENFLKFLNPDSIRICTDAVLESSLATATDGQSFQFERLGYFIKDPIHGFHRSVSLKDSWAKQVAKHP
jgi:glutaminyl-tRNA synthetase